jgi:hypothetical protein
MHDRPAYELQITQLAIVQMIIVILKNSFEAYKFALVVREGRGQRRSSDIGGGVKFAPLPQRG